MKPAAAPPSRWEAATSGMKVAGRPGPAPGGNLLHLLAWPVLLLWSVSPCSAWPGQGETFVVSLGLSDYRPSLKEVRRQLQEGEGGRLVPLDDYRGKSLHLALALSRTSSNPKAPAPQRELSYSRYRARAASGDFLVEIEKFTGALLRPFGDQPQARLRAYWGGGLDLIRMKREGAPDQRGVPPLTQSDWLWGLAGFAGIAGDLSTRLSLDLRYRRDFAPASSLNGVEFHLGGQGLIYALALRF